MKKLALLFIALALFACGPKPKLLKVMSDISRIESAPSVLTQTFTVSPGDLFRMDLEITTPDTFHSVGFNITVPACLAAKTGTFTLGDVFTDQNPDPVCNYFVDRIYIAVSVDPGKPGATGTKLIGSHVFTATGPGSGLIALTQVKALKYDDSQLGFSEFQTTAQNMEIVFEQAVIKSAVVTVKMIKL